MGKGRHTRYNNRVSSEEKRRRKRKTWPIRRFALGEEPSEDIAAYTTPEERLAMVWELTLRAWRLAGRAIPRYPRHKAPGRLLRRAP